MKPATLASEAIVLLEQAAEWRLLGLLFEYPSPEWRANLEALEPALPRSDLQLLARTASSLMTEGLHLALFGPAGAVKLREVAHQGGVQSGYLLAELTAYYDAFGYQASVAEAPDHLAVELGFLAFLRMKQAQAVQAGNIEHAQLTAEAAERFLREHVAVQGEPVLRALENFAPDFLGEAGRLILNQAGPAPRSSYPLGGALFDDDDGGPLECGDSPPDDELIPLTHLERA